MFLEECDHVDYKGTKNIYEIRRATRGTFVKKLKRPVAKILYDHLPL
jgi:hypothetical protein